MDLQHFRTRNRRFHLRGDVAAVGLTACALLLLAGCGASQPGGPTVASGAIEGERAVIASEVSGPIVEMTVDCGDEVQVHDVLLRLDDATLQSQRLEAEAGLAMARANLAHVQARPRPEELAAARATLAQSAAAYDGALQAVVHAREAISNPLTLDVEINAARTEVHLAEQNVEMARADLQETELKRGVHVGEGDDVERAWDLQVRASQAALAQAQADLAGKQQYLKALLDIKSDPLELNVQLHSAETQAAVAKARRLGAQARLDEVAAGAKPTEVAIAEAQVQQAEAAVGLIDAQIARLTLRAPMDGAVTECTLKAGEMTMAGAPILTIATLDEVELVIYVSEASIGQVTLGQEVDVQVDSFPGQVFKGQVTSIAGEAQFTPRSVQTQEERVNLVFAVKVTIPNPDHALKPGMPADAILLP